MNEIISIIQDTLADPSMKHASMTHLPIALVLIGPVLLLAAGVLPGRRRMMSLLSAILYIVLAISALFTLWSGEDAYDRIGGVSEALAHQAHDHGEMAERIWTFGLALAAIAACGLLKKKQAALAAVWTGFAGGLFLITWTIIAAHKGGVLVYDHGVGTPNPMLPEIDSIAHADPRAQFFLENVRPVLEDRCMGCHRSGRDEGGFIISNPAGILAGGDTGDAIVPGKPDAGSLLAVLQGSHPDIPRMPRGDGGPLLDNQIEAIRTWIEQGAVWADPE